MSILNLFFPIAHCHRKLNLRAVLNISSDPILFTNAGNLDNIVKKLLSFLDEDKIILNDAEMKTLKNAKFAIDNRLQKEVSDLDVKAWDSLLGEIYTLTYLL
jgi:hypothetical protein